MKKSSITILIILGVIIFITIILNLPHEVSPENTAKCIGEKSTLYVRSGCHFCQIQEENFGNNYKYLNVVDCLVDTQECIDQNIEGTPTWIINEKKYLGVKSIDELKEITGC